MTRALMKRRVALAIAPVAVAALVACTRSTQQVAAEHSATVTKFCTECHSEAEREAGLVLENADLVNVAAQRAKWEKVVHKLRAGLMPPPGEPRPSNEVVANLATYLETSLDASGPKPSLAVPGVPDPGRKPPTLRRNFLD